MTASPRNLALVFAALMLLHAVAAIFAPATLWGISHLVTFSSLAMVLAFVLTGLAFILSSRLAPVVVRLEFPGRRGAALAASISLLPFWLLRESTHFFGDGYLLLRDDGFSESVTRAPVLVHSVAFLVRRGRGLGLEGEATLAAISALAGAVVVYAALRLVAHVTEENPKRLFLATLLLTCGAMQLFFGHVEYYGVLAAAVICYLTLAAKSLRTPAWSWTTLPAFLILASLHLSALGLVPAQAYLAWRAWRQSRRPLILATVATVAVLWILVELLQVGAAGLAQTSWAGLQRYTEPYTLAGDATHAFGFFSGWHFLAVANDLLLTAPMALALSPFIWHRAEATLPRFLLLGSIGAFAVNFVFYRELGSYRDWDILAPYAFVHLAFVGCFILRARRFEASASVILLLAAGLLHTLPWVAMNASTPKTLDHVHRALSAPQMWSPHARGYLHEEIAIYHRGRGDVEAALREYELAVQANPADSRFRTGLANRYLQRREFERAAEQFFEAVRLRPRAAIPRIGLAQALLAMKRPRDASEHASTAVHLDPNNAVAWLVLARVEATGGDLDRARASAGRALELQPGFPQAMKFLQSLPPPAPN